MQCNENCYFCYQKNKEQKYLDIKVLEQEIKKFEGYKFPRTAIYGGQATIRQDLPQFIKLCSDNSENVSMTSNGTLLTEEKLIFYAQAGLKQLGISVPTIKHWSKMRTKPWNEMVETIFLAKKIIPNVRINIVENIYNMNKNDQRFEFYDMMQFFTKQMGLGVLICRNFTAKYPNLDLSLIGFQKLDYVEYGCAKYKSPDVPGIIISYYEPVKVYKQNDYIVTPIGIFTNWMKFIVSK